MHRKPLASVHTPDELLAGAQRLLTSDDPVMLRAAVLEAITALEAFVHHRVFAALKERLDPLLVRWLEDKTRMDFDARLTVLTPIATGLPVDQQAELWARYKRAKKLRNSVTHSGQMVSSDEAREVIRTVHDWLAYLASSAEVDTALIAFKREVETGRISIEDERSASQAIAAYFAQSAAATSAVEYSLGERIRADVVLRFGNRLVIIEVKFARANRAKSTMEAGVNQLESMMKLASAERGALVLFSHEALPQGERHLLSLLNGSVSVVRVHVPHSRV